MVCATHSASADFYALLQVSRDASLNDVKVAYRRTLLRLHPDKQRPRSRACSDENIDLALDGVTPTPVLNRPRRSSGTQAESVDVALLKEAYRTLSDVGLRATYDASLKRELERKRSHGSRPAQVVSLDEFTATETGTEWQYRCRCGGMYRITQDDLENDTHLVGCESCSEVVWVGYEEVVTGGVEE